MNFQSGETISFLLFESVGIWIFVTYSPKHLNPYELSEIFVVKSSEKFGFMLWLLSLLIITQIKWDFPERHCSRNTLYASAHLEPTYYQEYAKK